MSLLTVLPNSVAHVEPVMAKPTHQSVIETYAKCCFTVHNPMAAKGNENSEEVCVSCLVSFNFSLQQT